MKKKIIMLFVICLLLLSLTGFSRVAKKATLYEHVGEGRFKIIEEWSGDYTDYYVVCERETKVMYFIMRGRYMSGITPLYNADGTLQIYDGNE